MELVELGEFLEFVEIDKMDKRCAIYVIVSVISFSPQRFIKRSAYCVVRKKALNTHYALRNKQRLKLWRKLRDTNCYLKLPFTNY